MENQRLHGEIVPINSLNNFQIDEMYGLMVDTYERIDKKIFKRDLSEKKDVILLRDEEQKKIRGFSTLMLLEERVGEEDVTALFSGDTVIGKNYWGTQELPKWWLRYASSLIEEEPNKELYWFLLSKGYKTYRFLPVFFNEFYPRRDTEIPDREQAVLDTFALSKFGQNYHPEKGIISFGGSKDYLKKGIADIDDSRMKNPDIEYFAQKNPGWEAGDELTCIVKLTKSNFNRRCRRVLNGK